MTTIKAKRAQITVGDQDYAVYQLPNGDYGFTKKDLRRNLSIQAHDTTGKKHAQPILDKHADRLILIKADDVKTSIHFIPLDVVTELIYVYADVLKNPKCIALSVATVAEALERRADAAFGVIRNEEERNERFVTRRDSILSRNFWTDVIEDYIKTHEVSDNYKRFVHINVSNYLNKALFNMNSKQIRAHYDIGDNSPRDYFPSDTLKLVDTIEKATAVRVQNNDVCPKQALKDVVMLLGIEPDANRL